MSFPLDGDVSNVAFTLAVPTVTVTMPNTNVLWNVGSNQNVSWPHNLGAAESVDIEISRDGGTTWAAIASDVLNTTNSHACDASRFCTSHDATARRAIA